MTKKEVEAASEAQKRENAGKIRGREYNRGGANNDQLELIAQPFKSEAVSFRTYTGQPGLLLRVDTPISVMLNRQDCSVLIKFLQYYVDHGAIEVTRGHAPTRCLGVTGGVDDDDPTVAGIIRVRHGY